MKKSYLKSEKLSGKVMRLIFLVLVFLCIAGSLSAQKSVRLAYNMPAGKTLNYSSASAISQLMDIQGQTMEVIVNTAFGFKAKMVEKVGQNLKISITVDSLIMSIDAAMQGVTNSRVKDIEGKSFNMVISPAGKVVDISEAEKIQYSVQDQGNTNLSQSFRNIFPVLPEKSLNPGETWTSNDTIYGYSSVASNIQELENTYKYEGVEKVNGIECAKITSSVKGNAGTKAQSMGMDVSYGGPLQGQATFYFAIKEGFFVKQEVSTRMNGTMEISGPQSMTFPVTVDTRSTIEAR